MPKKGVHSGTTAVHFANYLAYFFRAIWGHFKKGKFTQRTALKKHGCKRSLLMMDNPARQQTDRSFRSALKSLLQAIA